MTSQIENNTNFEMELLDLQKQLGEEKRAHGETLLRYLSAQAQAQAAEAKADKAQELVAETTMKLIQASEEIKGLRSQAQEVQANAREAQIKIKDLETQVAEMKIFEQDQIQTTIEAQEEVRSLRAQAQELQDASTKNQESLARELETAQAKIASLEARIVKIRVAVAESDVTTYPEPTNETQELKAAQAKIENLEVQVAQMKLFERFQAQTEELKAALAKITELETQLSQSEKQAQGEILSLNSEIQDFKAQTRELHERHANYQNTQTRKLEAAQSQIKNLELQVAGLVFGNVEYEPF